MSTDTLAIRQTPCVLRDHNSHVALLVTEAAGVSEYIVFEPVGAQLLKARTTTFERQYSRLVEMPVSRAALSIIKTLRRAYLPGEGVAEKLMEIYFMTKIDKAQDLTKLDTKQLLEMYNELAEASGKQQLKVWKGSKAALIERFSLLHADVAAPTTEQQDAKAAQKAATEKRLAPLNEKKAEAKANKAEAKSAKRQSAVPVKPASSKKPKGAAVRAAAGTKGKGKGIGAFCCELIRAGRDNDAILKLVASEFPEAKTSAASLNWYRNKIKQEGGAA